MTTKTTGFSIWLIPKEREIYKLFFEIIKNLSAKFKTPEFAPHVTLIGGIEGSEVEVIKKVKDLVSQLQPFRITLEKIDGQDFFFRSLFILAKKTSEVFEANKKAQGVFGKSEDYLPHLSLLYSNISREEKEKVKADLKFDLPITFSVDQLILLKTVGVVNNWKVISKYDLI